MTIMIKKIPESIREVECNLMHLEDNDVCCNTPYSMTKISFIASEHSDIDIT